MSSNIEVERVCQYCGKRFVARTTVTKFCSHACSQKNYKKQKRGQKIEKCLSEITDVPPLRPILSCRDYMSCEQVADLMGISRTTVYRYCVTGKMNCVRMNRKIFIRRSDVDLLFDTPRPYEVTPTERKPITEFYSLREITEKFGVSESTVYSLANAKRIPKLLCQGKTIYSKKHIDRHFALKAPDPKIPEWYTVEDIREKYDMSISAVNSFTSEYAVPRKKAGGKTFYSKSHTDTLLQSRLPDPGIKEWYSMDEIVEKYSLSPGYISNLIYKNPVPKIRRGNKGYYSKEHFDRLMQEKFPVTEYYTTEQATARLGISRDALYHYIKRYGVPTIRKGRTIRISKTHLDNLFKNE